VDGAQSLTWTLLSPLGQDELRAIADEAVAALAPFEDDADSLGDILRQAQRPPVKAIMAAYAKFGTPLDESVLKRLEKCESVLVIEDPADLDRDPLQVAVLRYLVDRMGKGFVLFNDFPLVETELVISELKKKKTVKDFAPVPSAKKPAAKKKSTKAPAKSAKSDDDGEEPAAAPVAKGGRAERPGELRAIRILRTLEAVGDNRDLAIDMRDMFRQLPVLSQRYAAFLIDEGVVDDVTAAKELGVSAADLANAIETLDEGLKSIVG
jgi:hypothetical protein